MLMCFLALYFVQLRMRCEARARATRWRMRTRRMTLWEQLNEVTAPYHIGHNVEILTVVERGDQDGQQCESVRVCDRYTSISNRKEKRHKMEDSAT